MRHLIKLGILVATLGALVGILVIAGLGVYAQQLTYPDVEGTYLLRTNSAILTMNGSKLTGEGGEVIKIKQMTLTIVACDNDEISSAYISTNGTGLWTDIPLSGYVGPVGKKTRMTLYSSPGVEPPAGENVVLILTCQVKQGTLDAVTYLNAGRIVAHDMNDPGYEFQLFTGFSKAKWTEYVPN